MSRTRPALRTFVAGELSPLIRGRTDLEQYQAGVALCENFVVLPQGPVAFRQGTKFLQYCASGYARLIPFSYSDDQSYVVEFSDSGVLRIHTSTGTLVDDGAQYAIATLSHGKPAQLTASGLPAALSYSFDAYIETDGMDEISGRWYQLRQAVPGGPYLVRGVDRMGVGPDVDSTGYGAFFAGTVSLPLELSHPYSLEDLPELRYAQSNDVLTIVHPDHKPYTLRRTGLNSWQFQVESFGPEAEPPASVSASAEGGTDGTLVTHYYVVTNVVVDGSANAESLASAAVSASQDLTVEGQYVEITATAPPAGTQNRYYKALNGLYGFIGQGGATFRDANITPDLSVPPPEYGPDFDATGDYPRAVGYRDQRKVFAGSVNQPQNLWLTRTGTEADMTYTVPGRDDNALSFGLSDNRMQTVQHVVSLDELMVLTTGGVWRVFGAGDGVLVPSNINARKPVTRGASEVTPVVVDKTLIYAFTGGGRIGVLRYSEERGGYIMDDLCVLASHLFDGYSILDMALMTAPVQLLWVLRSDGKLLSLTYQPEHQVAAWHQHDVGGDVVALSVIPDVDAEGHVEDLLFLAVKRTTRYDDGTIYEGPPLPPGSDTRATGDFLALETMRGPGYLPQEYRRQYGATAENKARAEHFYLDSAGRYDAGHRTVSDLYGLWHLEGQDVTVVADGAQHATQRVVGGHLALDHEATVLSVGRPYRGRLETLPLALMEQQAEGFGRTKNIARVTLNVDQTSGIRVGPAFDRLYELKPRFDEDYYDPPAWRGGTYDIVIDPLWSQAGSVCVEQDVPQSCVLLSMALDTEEGD